MKYFNPASAAKPSKCFVCEMVNAYKDRLCNSRHKKIDIKSKASNKSNKANITLKYKTKISNLKKTFLDI